MGKLSAFISRRRAPTFAIVSLPRCGSTAIYRALGCDVRTRIACEPDFGEAWKNRFALKRHCAKLFSRVNGIKHVWDPNGWPFTNKDHISTLDSLGLSDQWIEANAALLECVDKVVFLKRRNNLARVVSDLCGQQTGLWGHDPDSPHTADEAVRYRDQMEKQELRQIDEQVIEWYLDHAAAWESRILSSVPEDRKLTVDHLDIFGSDVDLETRVVRVVGIADWLGLRLAPEDQRMRTILDQSAKLNDTQVYQRIPNFRRIVSRFGEI